MAQVVLENVYKSFASRKGEGTDLPLPATSDLEGGTSATKQKPSSGAVLRRINLAIEDGEFMVLVGPSGCGKSTLLRLIAGLEQLTAGNIWVGDRLVNDLPPKDRDIAMVFQSYALYPHMTVYNNLAFGLRRTKLKQEGLQTGAAPTVLLQNLLSGVTRNLPKGWRYRSRQDQVVDERVRTIAQMLQIEVLLERLPKQLSGGQKQRVALGRAIARNPQVFLMDEPLSNLDAKLRTETRAQIVKLQRQLKTTTIYVTHDQTEAMTMGDRIAVMNAGQIQQIATPHELYSRPANRFVAEFIGSPPMNLIPVQVGGPLFLSHPLFQLSLPDRGDAVLRSYEGRRVTLGIRPEHLMVSELSPTDGKDYLPMLQAEVDRVEALGSETFLSIDLGEQSIQVRTSPDQTYQVGDRLWLSLRPDKIHLFDAESGKAL
ncbi:sugar ABC transporter ATP-binding protein [Leptolyngbya sp. 'hensonii']|uniref:ABC transporter ATP-binding protein n=1 Tax=Leptolyngbya sp. 'hensonii' TaxID=1922337 RepID=UPI00094FE7E6|nr:ATP-binding cassette domain-containing protein [Leptolyngbya sp. 'hensonii']OLP19284.1 sugar ABC transporter ATP-binding protein [Leptolyngbya sp. 'hensonii']